MSYLEIAKQALAELRLKRCNDQTPEQEPASVVRSFMSYSEKPYAFPWPDEVEGLGRRRVEAFDRCERCGVGSWVRYGTTVLCLAHAKKFFQGASP